MPFVTSFERLAKEEGIAEGKAEGNRNAVILGLKLKFGDVGARIIPEVRQINDPDLLQQIIDALEGATNLEQIRHMWSQ